MRAKEREIDDWRRIFKRADQRLKIQRVVTLPESATSLIKLVVSGMIWNRIKMICGKGTYK